MKCRSGRPFELSGGDYASNSGHNLPLDAASTLRSACCRASCDCTEQADKRRLMPPVDTRIGASKFFQAVFAYVIYVMDRQHDKYRLSDSEAKYKLLLMLQTMHLFLIL